ncbi:MAG: Rieske 2Fe-2S domain-containing protein [Candidatus Latescibacterota bacterium]|nr:MAG: Rieske 2Fe-2S domain-containing protein [Candidatus Latescibacterota bacterium]
MESQGIKRNIFQRILGIPATDLPRDAHSWAFSNGRIVLDLERVPELKKPGGAVRLEKKGLPERVLVIHDGEGVFHAFRNRCGHGGRRLDPVPGDPSLQCCSVGKSTYDHAGTVLSGPANSPIAVYRVDAEGAKLTIHLE